MAKSFKELKENRQKKIEAKQENKDKPEEKMIERQKDGFYLKKNLAAMASIGWDNLGLMEAIQKVPEQIIKIDPQIVLEGVKNPLITTYFGFSTRHLYDAMKRKKKTIRYVCIIEPNIAAFKHLICTEDISDLLTSKTVDFVVGIQGEQLLAELFRMFTQPIDAGMMSRSTMLESMQIIIDPFQYDTEEKRKIATSYVELVQDTIHQIRLSMGCSDDQYRRFELLIENKKEICNAWSITGLYDKIGDVPVVVLGGGPSLENFIEEYKKSDSKLKNSFIIAADAVLFKLLQNGIKPNIITRCERKLTNIFKGVTKEMTEGVYYAAYPWTPNEFFKLFDEHFLLFRQNGVCLFSELSHGFVDGGVSSGNAALELAINLGAKNIILSGIDLAFGKDGKTHVDGTQVEFNINKSKEKWTDIDSNNGGKVKTIPVWERCRNEYMQSIDKHTKKGRTFKVINTSIDGAVIPLTEVKEWKDITNMFETPFNAKEFIESNRSKLPQEEIDNFNKKIQEAIPKMKDMSNSIAIAIGLAEDARKTANREIHKMIEHVKISARDDYEIIRMLRANAANLEKLWHGAVDQIDMNFKQKVYIDYLFRVLIFDVLQLDLYHYENSINGTINTNEYLDERYYAYTQLSVEFMTKCKIYTDMFVELFQK